MHCSNHCHISLHVELSSYRGLRSVCLQDSETIRFRWFNKHTIRTPSPTKTQTGRREGVEGDQRVLCDRWPLSLVIFLAGETTLRPRRNTCLTRLMTPINRHSKCTDGPGCTHAHAHTHTQTGRPIRGVRGCFLQTGLSWRMMEVMSILTGLSWCSGRRGRKIQR